MRQMFAVEVTPENIDEIIEYAAKHQLNLKDHLRDNMEVNAEDGEDTMIVAHAESLPATLLYFDDMPKTEFDARYHFTNGFTRTFSPTGSFKQVKNN